MLQIPRVSVREDRCSLFVLQWQEIPPAERKRYDCPIYSRARFFFALALAIDPTT